MAPMTRRADLASRGRIHFRGRRRHMCGPCGGRGEPTDGEIGLFTMGSSCKGCVHIDGGVAIWLQTGTAVRTPKYAQRYNYCEPFDDHV
jgi:hypothetical protein